MVNRLFHVVVASAVLVLFCGANLAQAQTAAPAASAAPPAAQPAAGTAEKLEPLPLKLPVAQFHGTGKDAKSTHLDPNKDQRPPFMAPKGLENLAKGKPVTGSEKDSDLSIGTLAMITDGDKEANEGSYIEMGPGTQWLQVDLGKSAEIYAVLLWHAHSEARIYHDVIVQISDDAKFEKDVKTLYNNDIDNSSKLGVGKDYEYIDTAEGRLFDAKGAKARYVRCYSRGNTANDMNQFTEIEVWGRPAK